MIEWIPLCVLTSQGQRDNHLFKLKILCSQHIFLVVSFYVHLLNGADNYGIRFQLNCKLKRWSLVSWSNCFILTQLARDLLTEIIDSLLAQRNLCDGNFFLSCHQGPFMGDFMRTFNHKTFLWSSIKYSLWRLLLANLEESWQIIIQIQEMSGQELRKHRNLLNLEGFHFVKVFLVIFK